MSADSIFQQIDRFAVDALVVTSEKYKTNFYLTVGLMVPMNELNHNIGLMYVILYKEIFYKISKVQTFNPQLATELFHL